ncbi:MAG: PAS domain-containing sensor histidine kinase [Deltaproteobacteria bacterium]|nr:MAG: PAS domain-containing sensor histidine kinase [Deltaproteobacteria bacterium]
MKKKKRLIWQLYPSYLLIILISLGAVSGYASSALRHFFLNRTAADLKTQSQLLEKQIARRLFSQDIASVDPVCKEIGASVLTRITVMLSNGRVVGDSEKNPGNMENHGDRPDVIRAAAGQVGTAIRYSRTLEQRMMYVALPLKINDSVKGVLRTSIPLMSVDEELKSVQIRIAFGGCLIAFLASGICLYVSRRISHPIEEMKQVAEHFAKGELEHRLAAPNTKEMAGLADAMNQMAVQLRERIETVISQRNEYEAVLSSMVEGVVAIDMEERILSINRAAANILKNSSHEMKGRTIQEVVRNRELHAFVEETLSSGQTAERDIVLRQNGERILNIRSAPLCNANEKRIGTLVVLDDVTHLRHLEEVRRDFVANVSHEIRTPLTAIKGFVETLQNGAVDNPEEAERFLAIIEKHVNRLAAIIEELLLLSKIEREDEIRQIQLEEGSVEEVIRASVQACQAKAEEKNIRIDISCEDTFSAKADLPLLEQAVVNLLDNAIKYSRENSVVRVETALSDSEIIIKVQDHGMGISKQHLPRLFERFYRVDKARSCKLGGTGLGLAIVKHITQAHDGRVTVESALGKGSTFAIHLPRG